MKAAKANKVVRCRARAPLQKFYAVLYSQPSAVHVWVTLDQIPAALGGLLGDMELVEHMGSTNVMPLSDDNHMKRMGTISAMLGVKKEGDAFSMLGRKPAVLLKSKISKVVANSHNVLITTNVTSVIKGVYM